MDDLKACLNGGMEMTKEPGEKIKSFDMQYYGDAKTYNFIEGRINNIRQSKQILDKEVRELESLFGAPAKKEDG